MLNRLNSAARIALLFVLTSMGSALAEGPRNAGDRLIVAQVSDEQRRKEAFESAKELGTVAAWNAFLGRYSEGFYADLARAYIKKLDRERAAPPASAATPQAPAAESAVAIAPPRPRPQPPVMVGPGAGRWQNRTVRHVANSSRPAYTAIVDAGGAQLSVFCTRKRHGPEIVAGFRVTDALPGLSERLANGLAAAPPVTADLASVSMSFSDGSTVSNVSATKPPRNNQSIFYFNRKLLTPTHDVLERLMAEQTVTISAPPFAASFQLDGSRAAICKALERCDARPRGCGSRGERATPVADTRRRRSERRRCSRGMYRDRRGRCVREEDGQDGRVNCGRGRTWVGAQGRCVCVETNRVWNGRRCVAVRRRPTRCTGGRTRDPRTGRCDCNGDSAWNGRACVKQNEPVRSRPQRGESNQTIIRNCNLLNAACKVGVKAACKKMSTYCDRG